MFLGINVFCALLRAHFNPCLVAQAKMGMSRAQNIFMPANINPAVLSLFSEINFPNSSATSPPPLPPLSKVQNLSQVH